MIPDHTLTKVRIVTTEIKYFSQDTNEPKTHTEFGNLNQSKCKLLLKGIDPSGVFLSREKIVDVFLVDTQELIELKL